MKRRNFISKALVGITSAVVAGPAVANSCKKIKTYTQEEVESFPTEGKVRCIMALQALLASQHKACQSGRDLIESGNAIIKSYQRRDEIMVRAANKMYHEQPNPKEWGEALGAELWKL